MVLVIPQENFQKRIVEQIVDVPVCRRYRLQHREWPPLKSFASGSATTWGQVRLLHADNFRSSSWLRIGLFRPVDKRARIRGPDEGSGTLSLPPLRGSLVKTTSVQIVTQSPDWKPTDTDGNITAVGAKRSRSCFIEAWTVYDDIPQRNPQHFFPVQHEA